MRVFETLNYNLKQLKFKETKDFFDDLLLKNDFKYTDISFLFSSDREGKACNKAIKLHHDLSTYKQFFSESQIYDKSAPDYCLSSVFSQNNNISSLHIKHEHFNAFSDLLKKIPQTINFGFMGVILDNVNWYQMRDSYSMFSKSTGSVFYDHKFSSYYSNSIRFFKEFDYGNKYNIVSIMIDRTKTSNHLEAYPEKFLNLINQLGKPISKKNEYVFDEEERLILKEKSQYIDEKIKNCSWFDIYDLFKKNNHETLENSDYLMDSITPLTGLSISSTLKTQAKLFEFEFEKHKNECFKCKKLNKNNHTLTVRFVNVPFSSFVFASISISGYNFSHHLCDIPQIPIKNRKMLQEYLETVFNIASRFENILQDEFKNAYDITPFIFAI